MIDWLNKRTLKTKLIGIAIFYTFLLLMAISISIFQINNIGREIHAISTRYMPLIHVITKVVEHQLEQATLLERAIRFAEAGKTMKLMEVESQFKELAEITNDEIEVGRKIRAEGEKLAINDAARAQFEHLGRMLEEIEKQHGEYENHVFQLFLLFNQGKAAENKDLIDAVVEEEKQLDHNVEKFLDKIELYTRQSVDKVDHEERRTLKILMVLLIVCIFASVLPLSLAFMTTRVVRDSVESVERQSEGIFSSAKSIAEAGNQLAEQAANQAAAVEETTASLNQINMNIKENAKVTAQSRALIRNIWKAIQQTDANITWISESTGRTEQFCLTLNHKINTLHEIIIQIHTFAVNAGAEATRNETTQGFAIFADELRRLSQQAVDIIHKAVDEINLSSEDMKKSSEIASLARTNIREITNKADKLKLLMEQTTDFKDQESYGINEINDALMSINDSVQQNAACSEESAVASESLKADAESILKTVSVLVDMVGKKKEDTCVIVLNEE